MTRVAAPADQSLDASTIERPELFAAIHAALEQLGRSAPLLLLVEDVHWADRSTREMLSFLFSRRFDSPVAVVASYRTDDLHRRHPLRTVAAEWARLPGVTRVELARLADDDVRALVHSLHPSAMPERWVQGIVARAEGNAFFTEELLQATEGGPEGLPEALADLLLVRLDRLDDDARLVVRAAAVSGRRVPHLLLERVLRDQAVSLDAALRTAVERNVLVPMGGDGYAFRHALLAEAVYDDLLPGERVRLHAAYVDALQQGGVGGTAAELARHARLANDLVTAARASVAAGDEAMRVAGADEASRHYELALELATDSPDVTRSIGEGPDGPLDLVELTARACEAAIASGQTYRAIALARDQLRSLPASTPPMARLAPALRPGLGGGPRRHGGRRAVGHHRGDGDPRRAPRRADAGQGPRPARPRPHRAAPQRRGRRPRRAGARAGRPAGPAGRDGRRPDHPGPAARGHPGQRRQRRDPRAGRRAGEGRRRHRQRAAQHLQPRHPPLRERPGG